MGIMDQHEAKKLFFAFDGSFFFMDRELPTDQMNLFNASVVRDQGGLV